MAIYKREGSGVYKGKKVYQYRCENCHWSSNIMPTIAYAEEAGEKHKKTKYHQNAVKRNVKLRSGNKRVTKPHNWVDTPTGAEKEPFREKRIK